MKIKAIIVDDEKWGRVNLAALLRECCPEVNVIAEASSADEAIKLIHKSELDLLFLDIEIPKKTGFDILNEIKPINFEVIFCTAHNHYAIKAFKFNAVDYLLKPIDETELVKAVKRAEENIQRKKSAPSNLESLLQNLSSPEKKIDKIAVRLFEGFVFISIAQIIRCHSDGNYTTIYQVNNEKTVVAKSIKDYEDLLSEHGFYRIHNSDLINLAHIKSYQKEDGGYLTMSDEVKIEISRRRKDGFLELISKKFL